MPLTSLPDQVITRSIITNNFLPLSCRKALKLLLIFAIRTASSAFFAPAVFGNNVYFFTSSFSNKLAALHQIYPYDVLRTLKISASDTSIAFCCTSKSGNLPVPNKV